MTKPDFAVGDMVRPRPEWRNMPNNVPFGVVREVVAWGRDCALRVGDDARIFQAYVFEKVE